MVLWFGLCFDGLIAFVLFELLGIALPLRFKFLFLLFLFDFIKCLLSAFFFILPPLGDLLQKF